ncbi:serine/threonine/tyrosine-protein kinase HT1 [Hermetia illucens]|nr:serine/threonine/tyrosine-protein kinase HT1 [Hermetia illucens]
MFSKVATLPVPGSPINVDSPQRREFLAEGLPKQFDRNILGHGSYGTVIKAVYKDKQVAVKVIDKLNAEKLSTIANEANILGWHHENIIEILKIDSGPREAVVIMERFPGQCLQHILERQKLPLYHIIRISADIIKALCYCHDRNLLHLDVKPKNVLVAIFGSKGPAEKLYQCKLCDFGSSMVTASSKKQTSPRGTIRYMAPELLRNEQPTTKADIYSLGITMWQLKVRKDPYFWIMENQSVVYKVVKENMRPDDKSMCKNRNILSPITLNNCPCRHSGSEQFDHCIETAKPLKLLQNRHKTTSPATGRDKLSILFSNISKRFNSLTPQKCTNSGSKQFSAISQVKKTLFESVIIKVNSEAIDEDYELTKIFREKFTKHKKRVEVLFENLYENCWDTDPAKRPENSAVNSSLIALLKYFE